MLLYDTMSPQKVDPSIRQCCYALFYWSLNQFFCAKYEVLSINHPMLDGRLNLTRMKMILTSVSADHLRRHSELINLMAQLGRSNSSQWGLSENGRIGCQSVKFSGKWWWRIMSLSNWYLFHYEPNLYNDTWEKKCVFMLLLITWRSEIFLRCPCLDLLLAL